MLPRPIASETKVVGLCLGLPLARLGRSEGCLAPTFGGEDHRLLFVLGLEHCCLLESLSI
jgi:hypothetical protein